MNDAALEARRAYKRKWAKLNPEKVKAQQERYWNKIAEAASAASADKAQAAEPARTDKG